jgi:hypothetical protein
LLADPTADTGALHSRQVNAVFSRELSHQGRHIRCTAGLVGVGCRDGPGRAL